MNVKNYIIAVLSFRYFYRLSLSDFEGRENQVGFDSVLFFSFGTPILCLVLVLNKEFQNTFCSVLFFEDCTVQAKVKI